MFLCSCHPLLLWLILDADADGAHECACAVRVCPSIDRVHSACTASRYVTATATARDATRDGQLGRRERRGRDSLTSRPTCRTLASALLAAAAAAFAFAAGSPIATRVIRSGGRVEQHVRWTTPCRVSKRCSSALIYLIYCSRATREPTGRAASLQFAQVTTDNKLHFLSEAPLIKIIRQAVQTSSNAVK